ncbi:MAG: hypothetical protein LBS25_01160 [Candidatus Symbiothrix sp.]|jgi:signal transduction histidine kinase|nr:hypothetical protein [Candidatus Symbiothrix sp.]
MRQTFTLKLAFRFCLILILFACGILIVEQHQGKKYKTAAMEERLDSYAEIAYRYGRQHADWDSLFALLPEKIRLTLVDSTGTVLYDNGLDDYFHIENHLNRPEIKEAATNGKGRDIRLSASTKKEYIYYAKHFDNQYIRVALPYDIQVRHFLQPDTAFLYYLLILFVIGILFISLMSNYYGKIIKQLRDYAYSINHNKSVEHPDFPDDEIGEVSKQIAEDHKHLKQELTGNIAHELRTPVTGIRGYLETILDNQLDREKEREFVAKAHEQILLLSELIRDMSLLSKINESPNLFKLKPVNLQQVINKVKEDLSESLQAKNIVFHSTVPTDLMVLGNENLLYSVFRNLTDNVIHYAGENVEIQVGKYDQNGKLAFFSFSDNGAGIADEKHLSRLFERFYRVEEGRSRDTGGSGLGLSIVKNVILFHGGAISVKNGASGGLEFSFSLPVKPLLS